LTLTQPDINYLPEKLIYVDEQKGNLKYIMPVVRGMYKIVASVVKVLQLQSVTISLILNEYWPLLF